MERIRAGFVGFSNEELSPQKQREIEQKAKTLSLQIENSIIFQRRIQQQKEIASIPPFKSLNHYTDQ